MKEIIDPHCEDWQDRLREWEPEHLDTGVKYPTGEDVIDAYWRTLVRDSGRASFQPSAARLSAKQIEEYRELFLRWSGREQEEGERSSKSRSFPQCLQWSSFYNCLRGWTFCTTKKGYMGLVRPDTQAGDKICILYGSPVPLVLREVWGGMEVAGELYGVVRREGIENDADEEVAPQIINTPLEKTGLYQLVGSAYVHGVMDGEVL